MKSLILISLLLLSPISRAAFSNYNSILIGDLVAGMGGAGTALVGDVAASPFYNPATLGMLNSSAFSAAVGVYKKFDTYYGEATDYLKTPLRVTQGYFRSIPSSVGNAVRLNNFIIALSIVVPDYNSFKGDLYNVSSDVTTLSYTDESLWTGVAVATPISETEAIGLTMYYSARNYNQAVSDRSFDGSNAKIFSSEKTKQDNTLMTVLGYYRKLNEQWALGLSYRPRSVRMSSKLTLHESTTEAFPSSPPTQTGVIDISEASSNMVIPSRLALGVSYKRNLAWLFSADVSLHEAVSYSEYETMQGSEIHHRQTINFNFGAQRDFYSWLRFRAGFYTDISAHPEPASADRYQEDHVNMYGFSANVTLIAGDKIGYTFGGYYNGGKGVSRQRINHNFKNEDKTQHIFTMLLGTSFYF